MSSGLTGKNIVIAIALAIGVGIVGYVIGYQIDAIWLGYAGSVVAVVYLVFAYSRAQKDDAESQRPKGVSRRG